MTTRVTPTLALVIAGGLAAGIALARPATPTVATAAPTTEVVPTQPARGGYLGGDRTGGGEAAAPVAGSPAPAPAAITIRDFAFSASPPVAAGQAVTVTNGDGADHTLTADSGAFDTGNVASGASATFTAPIGPGTYTFFCAIHPSMQGSLTVQ